MREITRIWVQGAAVACFVVGLMLFLNETRSTGEAPETLKLFISTNTLSISGAALMLVAVVSFGFLYVAGRKHTRNS